VVAAADVGSPGAVFAEREVWLHYEKLADS
jgi:hypothetical protein